MCIRDRASPDSQAEGGQDADEQERGEPDSERAAAEAWARMRTPSTVWQRALDQGVEAAWDCWSVDAEGTLGQAGILDLEAGERPRGTVPRLRARVTAHTAP
eukprot:13438545-Alexandrium_andersonii.AAC.1